LSGTNKLLGEFSDLFDGKLGKFVGRKVVIHMREGAAPRVFKARPIPFSQIEPATAELERLIKEDVLEPIDPATMPIEWASPAVYDIKANGKIRLCFDAKVTINPWIITDQHPLPRFEEIMVKLNGCKYFTKIDAKDAYLQMEVAEESRKYL